MSKISFLSHIILQVESKDARLKGRRTMIPDLMIVPYCVL